MCRFSLVLAVAIFFSVSPLPTGAQDQSKWTIDDILHTESARDWQVSPDGRWAVWAKRAPNQTKGEMISNIMLSSLADKKEVELTRGNDSCVEPRWAPDGQHIGFLTARPQPKEKADGAAEEKDKEEPEKQLWIMNPFGGEPWPITEGPREVSHFHWADAHTIIFAAQEKAGHRETTLKDKKDTSQVIEDEVNEPPVRLFKVDVEDKKVKRLTDNTDRIQSFALSPGGRHAVAIHERSLRYTYDQKIKPAVYLHDLKTGERSQLFAERRFNIMGIHWSADGKGFYALNAFTHHPLYLMAYVLEPYYYELASGEILKVNLDWHKGLADALEGSDVFTATADGFIALLADGARTKAARFVRDGKSWKRSWLEGDHTQHLFGIKAGRDGKTLLYLHSTASKPGQWYRAKLDGGRITSASRLTQLAPDIKDKTPARTELIRWKGAQDEEVEGILYYPSGYQSGKRYPLVVMIHGGPAAVDADVWEDDWSYPANLVSARGALVLKPNYHGSTNYGLKWVESLAGGKYYDLPLVDIEKGIESLIARGLADPGKLGLSGWSNGAILTMALLTRNPRYKAAVAGAGGSEWVADWGTCEFGLSFSNYYLGKSPLEDPQLYMKNSPFFNFAKIRTPTLLLQGADDRIVPPHHGWMQYRALQQLGKADVRFLLFPGEKHSLKKLPHRRRKLQEELAWFDKYLFQTLKPDNPALKKGSPLERAVQLQQAARQGKRFGLMEKGTLIPETVPLEELLLGRFEVTRAQFAEFDKSYTVEPGRENFPASGITFQQARDYCAWLGKLTGHKYRLGKASEMKPIYDSGPGSENTLDYWAGYAVNPEDAARLLKSAKELSGAAPLLKEVGSFPSSRDKTLIFDLGGNVAEWVDDAGRGVIMGGSAFTAADHPASRRTTAPEYIGFRVVKETGSRRTMNPEFAITGHARVSR